MKFFKDRLTGQGFIYVKPGKPPKKKNKEGKYELKRTARTK